MSTEKGAKPIERIPKGDKVWAQAMVTGKKRLRTVLKTFSHVDTRMMTLVVAGKTVRVTTEHPFHTPDRGWVGSGEFKVGDRLTRIGGLGGARVDSITKDDRPTRVFNFSVEGNRNYAVTGLGLLVHNASEVCDLAAYSAGAGHHIPAKKMFQPDGDQAAFRQYVKDAPAIPNSFMQAQGISHPKITGSQKSQYNAFDKTGRELGWDDVQDIETRALVAGGVPEKMAGPTVAEAIRRVQEIGMPIQRIPWGSK